ncbi:uncharacterized protein K489DRAFT_184379 [Dissoconium aciculare CBS 342.82]|uniref:DUF202 domain-containing protein n=1 Tax=Dissoconium aciculare CBS 342.82 TaxID=1314786 RepID=A0A6J3M9L1_9PEZI|nr:uncharacterized protein K489DRAFT_184379 [Dissoconium aciculare CBS 342.82]KAF1824533.1 hypothetical protein K489DRAFT_184379 [Dissoconium aciculare CBS 342.82]
MVVSTQMPVGSLDVAQNATPAVNRQSLSNATASTSRSTSVQEPRATHRGNEDVPTDEDDDRRDREATELDDASMFRRVVEQRPLRSGFLGKVQRFWRNEVRLSVPHADCRDHLANERTFLAYLRTSLVFSMLGVLIAQLYRLQHSPSPGVIFGYYVLSLPLSILFQCAAILVLGLGCIRFYRQQAAMARGKVHAGGWDLYTLMGSAFMLMITLFTLHITVSVYVEKHKQRPL